MWTVLLSLCPVAMAEESETRDEPLEESEAQPSADEPAEQRDEEAQTVTIALPIYIPPNRGAAKSRVGAATRGPRTDLGKLLVLAPDHVGLSSDPQPKLYWYLDRDSDTRIDLSVIDDRNAAPLLERTLAPPVKRGFHVIDCAAHGITMEPGRIYQWFVAFVPQPSRRSHDVIAGGAVEVTTVRRAADASAGALAREGLWYDAVAVLQRRYRDDPNNARTLAALNGLAEQVDLELDVAR